ncbi:hypothetical protein JOC77_003244 [Peribacillus deserti]|uniref:Uncharacterized protein n=1 Tax=Peribacillus deserti TaxID=673318 RepID=A0ABS2QKV3_9BACI|nr:hypothetical protein [Peribacillus deserti]MBM7693800.1 hypothetical protein [Peribacillus deserti]
MIELIHECFIDALGMPPSDEQINNVTNNMPAELVSLAERLGENDKEVRDQVYVWLNENINDFL